MIKLLSQQFKNLFTNTNVNWLLANVGDKLTIESHISVETHAISTSNDPFVFNNNNGVIGAGWIQDVQNQFTDFKIGDTVLLFKQADSSFITATITDKLDDGNIQINATPAGGVNFAAENYVISITTAINAVKYQYGFVENAAASNFISPIDNNEPVLTIASKAASDTSTSNMVFICPITSQTGSATIAGIQIDNGHTDGVYKSQYKIIHTIKVTPYILYDQITNQQSSISPTDFQLTKCWKFISKFQAAPVYTDPNYIISEVFDTVLGNTGWYGENFNTSKTNYSISSISYKDNGGNAISSIELDTTETTVEIHVKNTVDTPFSNNNTQFFLGIFKVPQDPSEYQANSTDIDTNFLFDSAFQTVGSASINGVEFGVSNRQILKTVVGTFISSSEIKITFGIDMLSAVVSALDASKNPSYFIYVSTQNYTLAANVSDLVSLQADMQPFFINNTDTGMIVVDPTVFLRHPEANPVTEGVIVSAGTPETLAIAGFLGTYTGAGSGDITITFNTPGSYGGSFSFTSSLSPQATALLDLVAQVNADSRGFKLTNSAATSAKAPAGSGATPNALWYTVYTGTYISTGSGVSNFFAGGIDGVADVTLDVYPQDEIVACSNFYIESSGRTGNAIKLTSINAQVIAKNGAKSFELDQFLMDLSSIPLTGYTQQFDSQIPRVFNVPAASIRKFIEVKRRNDLDTGTRFYFSSNYPFLVRWETWTAVLGVDPSFFDSTLPNNGFNQWWYRYGQASGWSLYYNLIIKATKDGIPQVYTAQIAFAIHDYISNPDFTTKNVLTFNPNDLALLLAGAGGARQLVQSGGSNVTINGQDYARTGTMYNNMSSKTLMVAIFTKTALPSNANVEMAVEVYKQGGIAGERVYSSKWVSDGNSWFTSVDGSGKVVLNAYGDSIVAVAYFDPNTPGFPANATAFSFSARIYEIGGVLETDDSVPITNDDGVQITVD